jgi:hypothetical protein
MWTALAMTAALSFAPGQKDELAITNVRPIQGIFGAPRKDADNPKILPGEVFILGFDIEHLKPLPDGRVQYGVGMEWTGKDGKVIYSEEPKLPLEITTTLGGASIPGLVSAVTPPDQKPGEYTLTAIVRDRVAKTEKKVSKKFEVLEKAFGIVQLRLAYDPEFKLPAPPVCVPGQQLLVSFWTPEFTRDKTTKEPHITFKVRVTQDGKPVPGKEGGGETKAAPAQATMIPFFFPLNPTRPGKFTIEIEAHDELSKKKATQSFELQVVEVK